ncbi:MAG TPA: septum formation initiator family protein [Candidatus Limnocylindria bacterium]|jgi:cell division protein FtsB|nr:septum formation initiator family protein [Candidatus Limnocylindria bacterium]
MTAVPGTAVTRARPPARRPSFRVGLRRRTFVALIVAGVVAIIAFNVGRQAFLGWSVGEQADSLAAQVAAAEAENAALQRQLEYLQSDAYVTVEARRLRNLGLPGEQVLIIPPGAAVSAPMPTRPVTAPDPPMLERWIEVLVGSDSP